MKNQTSEKFFGGLASVQAVSLHLKHHAFIFSLCPMISL